MHWYSEILQAADDYQLLDISTKYQKISLEKRTKRKSNKDS